MPDLIDHSFLQHRRLKIEGEIKKLEAKKLDCRESEIKVVELALVKQQGRLSENTELIEHITRKAV